MRLTPGGVRALLEAFLNGTEASYKFMMTHFFCEYK